MTDTMLLPCPFCGSEPEFPKAGEVYGTCYDAGCNDCGVATISIQIIDCFEHGESPSRDDAHDSWDDEAIKYGDEFIEVARNEALKRWNTRQAAHARYAPREKELGDMLQSLVWAMEHDTFGEPSISCPIRLLDEAKALIATKEPQLPRTNDDQVMLVFMKNGKPLDDQEGECRKFLASVLATKEPQ